MSRGKEAAATTPKQQRFTEEYVIDLNATQAAIRAGYSPKTARITGAKLLTNPNIQAAIEQANASRSARTEVTADRVVLELARIAFSDTRNVFQWGPNGVTLIDSDKLSDDDAATIAEVSETVTEYGGTIKAKRYDKVKALELLGKHLGMFLDRQQIDMTITPASIIEEVRRRRDG